MAAPRIAVIGAGMAGLAAARRLTDAGCAVVVFDKSRGVGGRMATRRVDTMAFDHGAQYFTARSDPFKTLIETWMAQGIVAEWPALSSSAGSGPRYIGVPGMTAPARALAAGSIIVTGCTVTGLARSGVDGRWSLHSAEGVISTGGVDRFDAVITAIPSPQAINLLSASGVDLPGLAAARYAPCWTLMVAASRPLDETPAWQRPASGVLASIARNSAKPGRNALPETLVTQASPQWSKDNLERTADEVRDELVAALKADIGGALDPIYATAHRWRYALVENAAGSSFLWNEAERIGACGDWCIGGRVEAAFTSGHAMAGQIIAELGSGVSA